MVVKRHWGNAQLISQAPETNRLEPLAVGYGQRQLDDLVAVNGYGRTRHIVSIHRIYTAYSPPTSRRLRLSNLAREVIRVVGEHGVHIELVEKVGHLLAHV